MNDLNSTLLEWFDCHKRDLPWRNAHHQNPYAVWVSEVMLQQTTVSAVIPFFKRWMERFPTVESLAMADLSEIYPFWQGLGYYSRVRNLHIAAQIVAQSGWPTTAADWRKLPGVGQYSSGAIASIAQNLPAALVDGNVERVFARLTQCEHSGAVLKKLAWNWAEKNLPNQRYGDCNQSLMELGATVCTPKNPRCETCPVNTFCESFKTGTVSCFPRPKPKVEWKLIELYSCVVISNNHIGLEQAAPGNWWAGMWHPPLGKELFDQGAFVSSFKHVVTKHKITHHVSCLKTDLNSNDLSYFHVTQLASVPISAPGRRAIELALSPTQLNLELVT